MHVPFWGEIPDDDLARLFADRSDTDLAREWDDNFRARAWDQIELICAEQERRAASPPPAPAAPPSP